MNLPKPIPFDRTEEMERFTNDPIPPDVLASYLPGRPICRPPAIHGPNTVFIDSKGNRYQGPDGKCSWPPNVPDLVACEIHGNHGAGVRVPFDGVVNVHYFDPSDPRSNGVISEKG